MSMRQLWEGSDAVAWAREIDGRTKLLVLAFFSIMVIVIDNPRTLFILFTISLSMHLLVRTSVYKWEAMAIFMLLGLWGSMFSQALFFAQTPRTPLFVLIEPNYGVLGQVTDGIVIYREGIVYGAIQGLRSITMLSVGLMVCWISDPRQLLRGLMSWHLSPQIAFVLVTAMRFLPVLASETGEILVALRLRSEKNNARGIIRFLPYIAKPLLARCLRRAQTLALSVVSRGVFLAQNKQEKSWAFREKVVCLFLVLLGIVIILSKLIYLLSEQGIYFGSLRIIYDWTKLYL